MSVPRRQTARRGLPQLLLPLALVACLGTGALAADIPEFIDGPLAPRFFPRSEDADALDIPSARRRLRAGCPQRHGYVPTDAPDDPSYVGSAYGLGKPSYYGFRPALGHYLHRT